MTDNLLIAFEEVGKVIIPKDETLMGDQVEFDKLRENVVREAAHEVSIDVDLYCAMGRKPLCT